MAHFAILIVRLYFAGRAHPIEYRVPWPESEELPPSPLQLVETMQADRLVDEDFRRICWDDARCELLDVCVDDADEEDTS